MNQLSQRAEVLSRLNHFRKAGKYCDVKLVVDGVEFPAHKNVLAAFSEYFDAMFSGELAEAKKDSVTLEGIEVSIMESLLEYAYTAELKLTNDNHQAVLQAANFLLVERLFNTCCDYLKSNLSSENCIGVYNLADLYPSADLKKAAKKFLLAHFLASSQEVDFLELEAAKLIEIIDDDSLFAEKEEHVFDAVMRWFHYKEDDRKESLPKVLSHVRLPDIDPYFLHSRLKVTKALAESEACTKLMLDVLFYKCLQNRNSELSAPFSSPRDSKPFAEVLLLFGNCKTTHNSKHLCVTANGEIIRDFEFPTAFPIFSCSSTPTYEPYCVKGDGDGVVALYHCDSDTWSATAMKVEWFNKALRNVDGRWYTFENNSNVLEVFENNAWKPLAKSSVAAVNHPNIVAVNGMIYVLGGKTKDNNTSPLVQQYDPHTDSWSQVGNLPLSRETLKTCVLNGRIYVFSADVWDDSISNTWRMGEFDVLTNQWSTVGSIPEKFAKHKICSVMAFKSKIYLALEIDTKCEIQVYSPSCNSWRDFPALPDFDVKTITCPMRVLRSPAVVSDLPQAFRSASSSLLSLRRLDSTTRKR